MKIYQSSDEFNFHDDSVNQHTKMWIMVALMLGNFLGGLESTVVGTAMPTVISELGGLNYYSWVFSAYMLAVSVCMPLFGKLSDMYGHKRMFFWAASLFLLGSVLSGLAHSMLQLVLFRAIQGIGAGGMGTIPLAIIGTLFKPGKRARAISLLSAIWGISAVVGPILGSVIVVHLGWRWVFYVNLPFGLLAMLLLAFVYHEKVRPEKPGMDTRGAISFSFAIVVLLILFTDIGKGEPLLAWHSVIMIIIFLLALFYFFWNESSSNNSFLPLSLFRNRIFTIANLCGFLGSFATFGVIAFLPLFVQSVRGGSSMDVGMAVMGSSVGWSFASIASGNLVHRFGSRRIIGIGILIMGVGFIQAISLQPGSSIATIIFAAFTIGMGMGIQTPPLLTEVQNSVDHSMLGVGSSTHMLARTIGGAIGVSMMGAALMNTLHDQLLQLDSGGVFKNLSPAVRARLESPQELLGMRLNQIFNGAELSAVMDSCSVALHNTFYTGCIAVFLSLILWLAFPHERDKR